MDIFTFITITTISSLAFVAYIIDKNAIQKKAMAKSAQSDETEQLKTIMTKLDNVLARVETLERLATDENEHLKRRFDEISEKPKYV